MRVDLFDFDLPAERIALRPMEPREAARLLAVDPAASELFCDKRVGDLPSLFAPGDVLVVNDTRVIPARLHGTRERNGVSARVEATLHKREGADGWRAFLRPAKKVLPGETIRFGSGADPLAAELVERGDEGEGLLRFSASGLALDAALERHGSLPLPPYIAGRRAVDARDATDYQTLFAAQPGAVAAPTASLHFTPALVAAIEARGVAILRLTLHVGAGTFLPVKAEDTGTHRMHAEWGALDADTAARINAAKRAGGRVIAAGTTSLRLLESAADARGRGPSLLRGYGHLHHARLPLPRRRPAAHQLPSAALHPVHAGFGVLRAGDHAARLCPRGGGELPLLQLRRRLSAEPGQLR